MEVWMCLNLRKRREDAAALRQSAIGRTRVAAATELT
jgi:hypothetical protein